MQKLEDAPEIEKSAMHPLYEDIRQNSHNEAYLQAWQDGKTGYPLIDACMRCLQQTGWLPFRMRAMLVSFASYHLWLDWRITAPHLARLFTDYEPGIHYSQFQMQSGITGINTIRIYNPIKQTDDHDKQGTFIRKWCPELANLPAPYLSEPHKSRLLRPYQSASRLGAITLCQSLKMNRLCAKRAIKSLRYENKMALQGSPRASIKKWEAATAQTGAKNKNHKSQKQINIPYFK